MLIDIDNEEHCEEFVRLNEQWIKKYFALEESDRRLALDPFQIVRNGGHILSVVANGRVVGVCALLKESQTRYQLARMAVHSDERGKGYGEALMQAAIELAQQIGGDSLYLLSNTVLSPAISLYRKHRFRVLSEGPLAVYARCNIVMERSLRGDDNAELREG